MSDEIMIGANTDSSDKINTRKLQDLHTSSSFSSPASQSVPESLLYFCFSVSHWGTTPGSNLAMTLACLWPHAGVTFHFKKHFRLLPQVRDSLLGYDCQAMVNAMGKKAQGSTNFKLYMTPDSPLGRKHHSLLRNDGSLQTVKYRVIWRPETEGWGPVSLTS